MEKKISLSFSKITILHQLGCEWIYAKPRRLPGIAAGVWQPRCAAAAGAGGTWRTVGRGLSRHFSSGPVSGVNSLAHVLPRELWPGLLGAGMAGGMGRNHQ